jgi:hypothetical protein
MRNLATRLILPALVVTLFTKTAEAIAPTDNLVLFYPFNGTPLDESVESNDGILSGAVLTSDRLATPSSAYHFNGRGNYIQSKRALPDSQSITVSLWFSLESWAQAVNWESPQVLFFEGDDTPGRDVACVLSGGLHFTVKSGQRLSYPNWLPPVRTWTHLVCVADAINHRSAIWVNGTKVSEATFSQGANLGFHSPFNLGRRPGGFNDWFFGGDIDQVRVYSRALKTEEILNIYNGEVGIVTRLEASVEYVKLRMQQIPGKTYILQSSADLRMWNDYGNAFVSTTPDYVVSVDATQGKRFWRLTQLP